MRIVPTVLSLLLLWTPVSSRCLHIPFLVTDKMTRTFINRFQEELVQRYDLSVSADPEGQAWTSSTLSYRIGRNNPMIGTPPDIPKAKFNKQEIVFRARVLDANRLCIEVNARVYNRKDRQWYGVQTDGKIENEILAEVVPLLLEGRSCWTLGNPPVRLISGDTPPAPGECLHILSAVVTGVGVRNLSVQMETARESLVQLDIPFYGDVRNAVDAFAVLTRQLAWKDPLADVPDRYAFYNAYATHGELMDGMSATQVLIAMGRPDKITQSGPEIERWHYGNTTGEFVLVIRNGELSMPE